MFSPASPTSPKAYRFGSPSTSLKSPIQEKSKSISIFGRKASKSQAMAETLQKLQSDIEGLKLIVSALNHKIADFKTELSNQKMFAESLASSIDQEGYKTPPQYEDEPETIQIKEANCCYSYSMRFL